jgi:hypothetical protein
MITNEQWNGIQETLKYHGNVRFRYQGTIIEASRGFVSEGKTAIDIYFDGRWKGVWARKDSSEYNPLTELFWSKRYISYYTPKQRTQIEKIYGKRRALKEYPKLYDKHEYLLPYFSKASVLVRQFKKIEGLELIPPNEAIIYGNSNEVANDK